MSAIAFGAPSSNISTNSSSTLQPPPLAGKPSETNAATSGATGAAGQPASPRAASYVAGRPSIESPEYAEATTSLKELFDYHAARLDRSELIKRGYDFGDGGASYVGLKNNYHILAQLMREGMRCDLGELEHDANRILKENPIGLNFGVVQRNDLFRCAD